jgi:hypothetical protein
MESPPGKEGAPAKSALPPKTLALRPLSIERQRTLELLCLITRSLVEIGDKIDDLNVLSQQQTDLLRRLIKDRVI